MNLIRSINRVEKLHTLILQEKTGTPKQLAEQLGTSRANLYLLISQLNALDMPVSYSRKYETFFYEREVRLSILFKVEGIEKDEDLRKINGGSLAFFLPSNLLDGANLSLHSYFANTKSQLTGL